MLYSEADLKAIHKTIKVSFIIITLSLLVCLGVIVPTLFFIHDATATWIKVLDSITFSIFLAEVTYIIINIIIPAFRRRDIICMILESKEIILSYDHCEVKEIKTINHSEKAYVIVLSKAKEKYYVYLDTNKSELISLLNHCNQVKLRNNYIVEMSHEKDSL